MEETLGKRITQNRRRLNMTQDKLAEQLGVTAQAVSKWENDLSCPDITMLPKLADIFDISTDALLGIPPKNQVFEAEIIREDAEDDAAENEGIHIQKGDWEFNLDGSRRGSLAIALWVLLVGGLLLAGSLLKWDVDFWDVLWPSGLLIFGLLGSLRKFAIGRLGCMFVGAYFLLDELAVVPFPFKKEFLLPAFLLIFGLSLLADALRKPKGHGFFFNGSRKNKTRSHYNVQGDTFDCNLSFGERHILVDAPRLRRGDVNLSFGELVLDLSGCDEIAPGCTIDASCSFGELVIKIPRCYRVEANAGTSFGDFEVKGQPDAQAEAVIALDASVSFGELCVEYI